MPQLIVLVQDTQVREVLGLGDEGGEEKSSRVAGLGKGVNGSVTKWFRVPEH